MGYIRFGQLKQNIVSYVDWEEDGDMHFYKRSLEDILEFKRIENPSILRSQGRYNLRNPNLCVDIG